MATISRRPSTKGGFNYRVQIRRKGHPTQSKTFSHKRDADEYAREHDREAKLLEAVADARGRNKILADLIDRYALEYDGRDQTHGPRLAWWKGKLGSTKLPRVSPDLIADALDDLRAGPALQGVRGGARPTGRSRSEATINRYHATLSAVFQRALKKRWGWVKRNPCREVERGPESKGRDRYLSDAERERLVEACRGSDWPGLYPLVVLAISSGARRGELLGLRWKDVDLVARRAILHDTKNGEKRTLPLVRAARDALAVMPRRLGSDLLFPALKDPTKPFNMYKPWWAAVRAADLEDFKFHDLRHSCASYLAMAGATDVEIADVLGHKTLAMVKRYAHLADQHKADLLERVTGRMLGGAS